jgi:hypothetical protein
MNIRPLSRLARPLALLVLLAGVLTLGATNALWATPAQAGRLAQTVPPREHLILTSVTCPQQDIEVAFNVTALDSDVTGYGEVSYVVNGLTRTASFTNRTGAVAKYVGILPPADQSADRRYNITSGKVTLAVTGGSRTIFLENPHISTANCVGRGPNPTPRRGGGGNDNRAQGTPTSTPTKTPLSGAPQGGKGCALGAPQANVGPNIDATVANCPWATFVGGGDISSSGTLQILPVPPAAIAPPSPGDTFIGPLADIVLFDASGNPVANPAFASPVDVCYFYGADEMARTSGSSASFILEYYDTERAAWVALPSTVDAAGSRVCTSVGHLTRFALAMRATVPAELPRTGAPATLPAWSWAALAGGLLALGALALRGARRQSPR